MTERTLLIIVLGVAAVTLALVFQINGVSRDEIVWLVGFTAGGGFVYAAIRGGR